MSAFCQQAPQFFALPPEQKLLAADKTERFSELQAGLERLRDLAALGLLDRLYVYAPDRLARKSAYQVLLLEEFQRGR